ncbi:MULTISPECIES: radical SAM family heme chaperone HemW [Marinitoga]|uniref:radical SAM family heme chaperone HemW n=1 Tax=Marinitoga TaxID=160798 RepID=UPI001494CB9B|nr:MULTISPECIES: radical SAM family heme chaperone HemW [Marinitoga]
MNTNKIGLYIHIPFCKSKCLYCDYPMTTNLNIQDRYFESLFKEIDLYKDKNLKIETLFLGGGTPTYVDIKNIEKLFKKLSDSFNFQPDEITIESNPEILTEELLHTYFSLGINRLSIGVQTFDNEILKRMNRKYNNEVIQEKYYLARRYFSNINFDFILGLPGDNWKSLEENIKYIEKMQPDHVSYYIFDSDHETPLRSLLNKGKLSLPDDAFIEEGYDFVISELSKVGYQRYEISNWAKNNFECKHNLKYWNNENYHGFGISAGGHIGNIRYTKTWILKDYMEKLANNEIPYDYYVQNEPLNELTEELFMGLRLIKGISVKNLEKKYGDLFLKFIKNLSTEVSDMIIVDDYVRLNEKGLDLSKMVFEKILEVRENIL